MQSSSDRGLQVEVHDEVVWLWLECPRVDCALAQRICEVAEEIDLSTGTAVVVLANRSDDFCIGVDEPGDWQGRFDFVDAIASLRCPVVAAIAGDAVAEGFELALAADLRVAGEGSVFRMPQVVDGSLPRHGGTQRLPRLVGRGRALDLMLLGRDLAAAEALEVGVVASVVADARVAAADLALALARNGPVAAEYAKELVHAGLDLTLHQGLRLEHDLYVLLQTTEDRKEGVRAFLEKRLPRFRRR